MYTTTLVVITFDFILFHFLYLYNVLVFLIYLLFILAVAFAAAGVILSSRLRNRYRSGFFSTLLYFQVFIFTFGFYDVWGQLVIKTFLSDFVTPESITRFTDISILLGLPFLVFAWLMLLKFASEISGRRGNNWFTSWFLIINFLVIIGVGYIIFTTTGRKPMSLIKYYYILLNFLYTIIASAIILIPGKNRPVLFKSESRIAASSMIIFMMVQSLALYYYPISSISGMAFIFLFFAGNAFFPVYLSYGTIVTLFAEEMVTDISFDEFCKNFDVSPRETDIIREICKGLSNKEISEKLFISLQTVKDHTHRIYIKTNVRSRSQLMNLVKDVRGIK